MAGGTAPSSSAQTYFGRAAVERRNIMNLMQVASKAPAINAFGPLLMTNAVMITLGSYGTPQNWCRYHGQ
jgi:hypothetical protein